MNALSFNVYLVYLVCNRLKCLVICYLYTVIVCAPGLSLAENKKEEKDIFYFHMEKVWERG